MATANLTSEVAAASSEDVIRVPFHVFIGEATDAAKFFAARWSPTIVLGRVTAPGLDSVKSRLPKSTGDELLTLIGQSQDAQTAYLLTAHPKLSKDVLDRALFVESEIEAVLEFLFDDGVEDEKDAQFAAITSSEAAKSDSIDALGVRLGQWVALAKPLVKDLDGLGGFDRKLIDEAATLSKTLLALPAPGADPKVKAKLDSRNRVLAVTQKRINLVRASARYVFRDRPEIVREVTSSYERKRKAAARRAKAGGGTPTK